MILLLSDDAESTVVIVGTQAVEQPDGAAVEGARVHDQNGHIREMRLQGFKQHMNPHKRKNLAYACQEQHIAGAVRRIVHMTDEVVFSNGRMKLLQQICAAIFLFHLRNGVCNAQIIAGIEEDLKQIAFNQMAAQILVGLQLVVGIM